MRRRLGLALVACGVLTLWAGGAQARTERLRWQHPNPGEVASFVVHVGTSAGRPTQQISVGKPTASGGVYQYDLQVADGQNVYVSVSARGTNGLMSARSNERRRDAPSSGGGSGGGGSSGGGNGGGGGTPLGRPGQPRVVGN